MKESKKFAIFSKKIAFKLMEEGFVLIDVAVNSKFKDKVVFYFENTQELKDAVTRLTEKTSNVE